MKTKYIYLIAVLNFGYLSCNNQKQNIDEAVTTPEAAYVNDFNNAEKINELSEKVDLGDTSAYNQLKKIYMYSGHKRDFLRNSLAMCENFKYPQAYLDTYFILKTDSIDSTNRNINMLANFFLLKAVENEVKYAKNSLAERFDINSKIPSSTEYLNKNNIINN